MGTIRISRFVGMAFLFSAIGQPSDLFALHEHARNGWMLGVSLGSGPGKYEDSETGIASSSEPGGLFTFRVGRMIQPSLLLDAELTFWAREETTGAESYEEGLILTNLALAGTFYPLDRLSPLLGGMYVRAGIGSGRITKISSDVNNISLRYHETGLGLLLGAGYELRVTKKLALGVGVSVDKFSIGGDVYESAQLIGYALDLNRYF